MRGECINAVQQAIGRPITQQEATNIEARIMRHMKQNARSDPAKWQGLSQTDRLTEAARTSAMELVHEAKLKKLRVAQTILAYNRNIKAMSELMGKGKKGSAALGHMIENTSAYIQAVQKEYFSAIREMIDVTGKYAHLIEDAPMVRDILFEVFGQDSGNAVAKRVSKKYLDTIEKMRLRFNRSGGDVGKLDYGYVPQPHDALRVLKAGADNWVAKIRPLLDRSRYIKEDGALMTDAEVDEFLGHAWETLSSGGRSKLEPGKFMGTGLRANRGSQSRQLHFKDAQSWIAYQSEFGQGTLMTAIQGHIGNMARDIALVEQWGPNADLGFKTLHDIAKKTGDTGFYGPLFVKTENMWDFVTGKNDMAVHQTLARVAQGVRNIEVASKLGKAVISSISDVPTYFMTTGFHRLPLLTSTSNLLLAFQKQGIDYAERAGFIADSVVSDMNRFAENSIGSGITGRLANATMKLSLMHAWTDVVRRAFSITMMGGLGKLSRTEWSKLDSLDRAHMEAKGVTADDWAIWQLAKTEKWKSQDMLTPEAIDAIPDTQLDTAIQQKIISLRQSAKMEIDQLMASNLKEIGWLDRRRDKFQKRKDAAIDRIRKFSESKEEHADMAALALADRMHLLDAQLDRAELISAMDSHLNKLITREDIRDFLNDVEDGRDAAVAFRDDARPAIDTGVSTSGRIGRELGRRQGIVQRRIIEMEKQMKRVDAETQKLIDSKAKKELKFIDEMQNELHDFFVRSTERQQKRMAVINRIARDIDPRIATARLQAREQTKSRFMAVIIDESEYAAANPTVYSRAALLGATKKGTMEGELLRSLFLFKSFPFAMVDRHWRRMADNWKSEAGTASKVGYTAGLTVGMTIFGAIAMQIKDILTGKDPRPLDNPKAWGAAFAQGGGMGIMGDLLYTGAGGESRYGKPNWANLAGPVASSVVDFTDLTLGNLFEAAKGEETNAGAEAVRFVKSHTPLLNLWYAGSVIDHAVLQDIQEYLSPGYLKRMEQRTLKDWDQRYWWRPGQALPDRPPDFERVISQ